MIIQALARYYEILKEDPKSGIPLPGYCSAKVSFALNISTEGELLDVISLEEKAQKGNKTVPKPMIVPEIPKKSSGITPNFMCNNSQYVLGIDNAGKPERTEKAFEECKKLHHKVLGKAEGLAAGAVLAFLDSWDIKMAAEHPKVKDRMDEILKATGNLVFRLDGHLGFLHDDPEIKRLWENHWLGDAGDVYGQCLVTGEHVPIALTHPSVKGVQGAQSSGASIVSFNARSYESYGKTEGQGLNAPVGKYTAFTYTTVLNHMLAGRKNKIQAGDATTVFWAESPDDIYPELAGFLLNPPVGKKGQDAVQNTDTERLVRDVLQRLREGKKIANLDKEIDTKVKFHLLGLSPNASRISIHFFYADSFGSFLEKSAQHYMDMAIVKEFENQPESIPVWMLLNEAVSPKSSRKEVQPLLAGAMMRAIVTGGMYPEAMYNAILERVRTDMDDSDVHISRVNYVRASFIKAYLVRKNKQLKEVLTVSLNESINNKEYLLGRLFAVLERAQQDANPDMNATIKDRYFASACATPAMVFPNLIKLSQHHAAKAEYGRLTDKRMTSIIEGMEEIEFPSYLTPQQQGTFIIGYYHQKADFFKKKEK